MPYLSSIYALSSAWPSIHAATTENRWKKRLLRPLALLSFCCCFIILTSCGQDKPAGWQELNLMRYNIPLSVLAPDSAKVSTTEVSGVLRDITITDKANNYYVQIFSSQAYTQDIARIKADQLDLVRSNPYFESVVEEEPNGFIYLNKIDTLATYGFRYVVFMGDKEIILQNGMARIFDEAAVRKMYEAVQQKSKR